MTEHPVVIQGLNFDRAAKRYGLATTDERRAGPLRYRWDLIERDVAALLARRDLPAGSPGAYPELLVNHFATIYLSCCTLEKRAPSQELFRLIAGQLGAAHFGLNGGKREELVEAQKIRSEETISNRALGKRVGVHVSTIGRWVDAGLLSPPGGCAT